MNAPIAILDSNVLFSRHLRSLFMELAIADLLQARWTVDIHREWMAAVLIRYSDIQSATLEKTRELMDYHAEGCIVEGYDSIIPSLLLPDLNDRHVLAAAIASDADCIVTFNLSDFPTDSLQEFDLVACHPDPFLME
jgi:predicted nucleic acid-binding protein